MDMSLTHETRGICLSALSGSAVTSGSYESGVLWLTNTQIVILDSIHLWSFVGVVTNNGQMPENGPNSDQCCYPRLERLVELSPGWGHLGALAPLPWQCGGFPRCCWAHGWWQLTGLWVFLCVCCGEEPMPAHGWGDAAIDGEGSLWCSSRLMLAIPKAVNDSKTFSFSSPFSYPVSTCRQAEQLGPQPPSADIRFGIRGNFVSTPWSMGGTGAIRDIVHGREKCAD